MSYLIKPEGYQSPLSMMETEKGIKQIKDFFQKSLSTALKLRRTTAPLFVIKGLGINDDLNGVERAVNFPIKELDDARAEIVHSLAKWKRLTLMNHGIEEGYGIYTDMNAIRSDEELGNLHSLYVDQWDWERVMPEGSRNLEYLKKTVRAIYGAMLCTEYMVYELFPQFRPSLPEDIFFIHSEELLKMYPNKTTKEREDLICQEHKAVFIMGIGGKLSNGEPHDGRAPDYDDWTTTNSDGFFGLNGDLMVWNDVLGHAFELSSMGIRVDAETMHKQLTMLGLENREELFFHKLLMEGKLPQSIGGGIGQSRLCMYYLRKAHIGEVQSSIWPEEMRQECKAAGIQLM